MNLKEANKIKEQLENDLKYNNTEREILLKKICPGATTYDKINTSGGIKEDRFIAYMEYIEENDKLTLIELDKKIKEIELKLDNINVWIINELETLKKYREAEQQIIYYKEQYQSRKPLTWEEISKKVNYSVRQCKRIYYKYKKGK